MCQIFYLRPGQTVDPEVVEAERKENPHGWGSMEWDPRRGEVFTHWGRGSGGLRELVETFNSSEMRVRPRAIHLRWASKGAKGILNQHPFLLNQRDIALMHNGTVGREKFTDDKGKVSDTRMVADWLEKLIGEMELRVAMKLAAEVLPLVDQGSRWLLMASDGTVLRLGEWKWQERLGVWTSQHLSEGWLERKVKWDNFGKGRVL